MKAKKVETAETAETANEIKILIKGNEHIAEAIIDTLHKALPQIEKVSTEFQELGIGNLTIDFLSDILINSGQETREKAITMLSKGLEGKSRLQANSLKRIFEETIEDVLTEIAELASGKGYAAKTAGFQGELIPVADKIIKYVSLDENGKPQLTDSGIQQIGEDNRLYIRTASGKSLYEKHCKAIEALNDLAGTVGSLPGVAISTIGILNIFTPGSTDQLFIKPEIDYDSIMNKG